MGTKKDLLTGGGLGDAAMALAKICAKYKLEEVSITHLEVHKNLLPAIQEFYESQGIENKVIHISSWKDKKKYTTKQWISTGWNEDWEIEPFPTIKYNYQEADVLVSPLSGRKSTRGFSQQELISIDDYNITYVGTTGEELVQNLKGKSLIGKTNIKELINLICSCNTIYTPEGFIAYLGSMAKKQVYVKKQNINAVKKRKHPAWDLTILE